MPLQAAQIAGTDSLRWMFEPDGAAHAAAVSAFKDRLRSASALDVVREVITHGAAAIIGDQDYTQLRQHVGGTLQVSPNRDVFMVGSAKLGFSIKPVRRYQPFSDGSDVDLAVVSPELYCRLWAEARRYGREGGMWDRDNRNHFKNDHFNGVIKPHVLPDSPTIPSKRKLFDLGAELQRSRHSPYHVTIVMWHSIEALEAYQAIAVEKCKEELTP
jgi:hypothetical protein